jgi:hypothetical protein
MDKERLKTYRDTYKQACIVSAKLGRLAGSRHEAPEATHEGDVNIEQQITKLEAQIKQVGDAIFNAPVSDTLSEATYDEGIWAEERWAKIEDGPFELKRYYDKDPKENPGTAYSYDILLNRDWIPPSPHSEFENLYGFAYVATSRPIVGNHNSVERRDALRAELQTFEVVRSELGIDMPAPDSEE